MHHDRLGYVKLSLRLSQLTRHWLTYSLVLLTVLLGLTAWPHYLASVRVFGPGRLDQVSLS